MKCGPRRARCAPVHRARRFLRRQCDDRRVHRRQDLRARDTLGLPPFDWNLFGQTGSLSFTAGVLLWPFVFMMTDVINEYFGRRGVRIISWLAVALIVYGFLFAYAAIALAPADWWVTSTRARRAGHPGRVRHVFGQGMWTIGGSIVAFLVGQLIDVTIFHRIRRATGERWVWLRATGSTAVSQLRRQLRRALHRVRARPAALADLAVPRGRHRQLLLQDGVAIALIPLIYLDAAPDRGLPRRRRGRGAGARRSVAFVEACARCDRYGSPTEARARILRRRPATTREPRLILCPGRW